jgi:uncharacterized membrane protein YfcA
VLLGLGTGVGSGLIGIGGGLVMNMYMGVFTDMPQVCRTLLHLLLLFLFPFYRASFGIDLRVLCISLHDS